MSGKLRSHPLRALAFPVFALIACAALAPSPAAAQDGDEAPTRVNQSNHPLLSAFSWRSVGPFGQGGRVDDIAIHPG